MMSNTSCSQMQRGIPGRTVPPRTAPVCAQPVSSPCSNTPRSREQLLQTLARTKFAMVDANLYLDTHPDSEEAICYYQKNSQVYEEAMEEYAKNYGPLTLAHAHHNDTYWEWVNQPWPWQ